MPTTDDQSKQTKTASLIIKIKESTLSTNPKSQKFEKQFLL